MADEVKVSRFGNARRGITRYFKEVKNELKKVIWPSRPQLINNTVTVLMACFVIGGIIWLVDWGLTELVKTFLAVK